MLKVLPLLFSWLKLAAQFQKVKMKQDKSHHKKNSEENNP